MLEARAAKGLHRTAVRDTHDGSLPCPWCGYRMSDPWEYSTGAQECASCDGGFDLDRGCGCDTSATRTERLPRFVCRDDVDFHDNLLEACEPLEDDKGWPVEVPPSAPVPPVAVAGCAPACPPAPGPAGLVGAGAYFQGIAEQPSWQGAPLPLTWAEFTWPAWVPASVRAAIMERGHGGYGGDRTLPWGPRAWFLYVASQGHVALGTWVTVPRSAYGEPSHPVLDTITGRYVPPSGYGQAHWIVFRDGRTADARGVGFDPPPVVRQSGFRHGPCNRR